MSQLASLQILKGFKFCKRSPIENLPFFNQREKDTSFIISNLKNLGIFFLSIKSILEHSIFNQKKEDCQNALSLSSLVKWTYLIFSLKYHAWILKNFKYLFEELGSKIKTFETWWSFLKMRIKPRYQEETHIWNQQGFNVPILIMKKVNEQKIQISFHILFDF